MYIEYPILLMKSSSIGGLMELKLPKAPEVKLAYSFLQNEAEWKAWTQDVLKTLANTLENCSEADKEAFIEQAATELYEEIQQCGYEEGYDTANCEELND